MLFEHGGTLVSMDGRAAARLLPALVPLLDGTRTVEEIVGEVGPAVEPAVRRALELFEGQGLLLDGDGVRPAGAAGAHEAAGLAAAVTAGSTTPARTLERLSRARVEVAGSAPAAHELVRLLQDAGIGEVRHSGAAGDVGEVDLLVAVPERGETGSLRATNEQALADERPWLQVLPHDGRNAVVGPLFLPGRSACHECYRMRRAASSDYEDDFEAVERVPSRAASPTALAAVTAGVAALLAIRWLGTADPAIPGRAYALGTRTLLELTVHHVLRVPRCPACSGAEEALASPWYKEAASDV
jgi:bacteriocin biosynthesis cyclodehydratase domain-containing protein